MVELIQTQFSQKSHYGGFSQIRLHMLIRDPACIDFSALECRYNSGRIVSDGCGRSTLAQSLCRLPCQLLGL